MGDVPGGGIDGERTRSAVGEIARERAVLVPESERLREPPTRHTSARRASPSFVSSACAEGAKGAPVVVKNASK